MKTLLKLTVLSLFVSILSCKKESDSIIFDYKYSETENVLNCENIDTALYHEALMAFEDDIMKVYNTKNEDSRIAYTSFFRAAKRNAVVFQDLASPHSMKVFEALKSDTNLWIKNGQLNYNADIFKCIGNNLNDEGLATTYKALIETNSMRFDIFSAPLTAKLKTVHTDRYLATFMALDMFYSKLLDVDPTKVNENKQNEKPVNTKTVQPIMKNQKALEVKKGEDEHAGHNHE